MLELRYDVDVFIAGGGPAGIAAAVAAARGGASVFLAESFGAFGGAGVSMLVPAFMQFGDGEHFLADGIGREVYDYIKDNSPERFRKYCPMSIPVETIKLCYDEMMKKSGALYMLFCSVCDVNTRGGRIENVICSAKGGMFAVRAKIYVDCTGDGDMCALSGAKFDMGDADGGVMASTLCGIWSGIDWTRVVHPDSRELERAFADKVFTNEDRHLPGMWRIADNTVSESGGIPNGIGGSNAGHIYGVDGTRADSLTDGIIKGRHQLLEYRRYYRDYLSGYEDAELVYSASYIGIRESRRVKCDYTLVLGDFLKQSDFPDEIGRYCYNIDIHSATNDSAGYDKFASEHAHYRYKKGESYGIPYRSLVVSGFENLLCAGRCISADRHMQSSIRVMPGCYITGQAAGAAAAIAAHSDSGTRAVDYGDLRQALVSLGAYLRNI